MRPKRPWIWRAQGPIAGGVRPNPNRSIRRQTLIINKCSTVACRCPMAIQWRICLSMRQIFGPKPLKVSKKQSSSILRKRALCPWPCLRRLRGQLARTGIILPINSTAPWRCCGQISIHPVQIGRVKRISASRPIPIMAASPFWPRMGRRALRWRCGMVHGCLSRLSRVSLSSILAKCLRCGARAG